MKPGLRTKSIRHFVLMSSAQFYIKCLTFTFILDTELRVVNNIIDALILPWSSK